LEQLREGDPDHPQRPSGDATRVRRPGGRPPVTERKPLLESTLHAVLDTHSAGRPTDERVRWTDLKPLQLAHRLLERGFEIGRNTAAALLDRGAFRRRALRKESITGMVDPTARILDATLVIGRTCSDTICDVKDRFIRHDRVNGQWNDGIDPTGLALEGV
jgi:hypothetical protein